MDTAFVVEVEARPGEPAATMEMLEPARTTQDTQVPTHESLSMASGSTRLGLCSPTLRIVIVPVCTTPDASVTVPVESVVP